MQEDIDLIQRYLRNALPPEELEAFQQRLDADEALRQELALHSLALEALAQDRAAALRTRFSNPENTLVRKKALGGLPWWRMRLLVLLLAFISTGLWFFNKSHRPAGSENIDPSTPRPHEGGTTTPPTDTLPQVNGSKQETVPDFPSHSAAFARIYKEHFKTYKNIADGAIRGDDPLDEASMLFFQLYNQGKYREALEAFPSNANNDLRFFKANVLLNLDNPQEAAKLLLGILNGKNSQYLPESRWYLALALLKSGRPEEALVYLKAIGKDKNAFKQDEAITLVGEVQRIVESR